MVKPTLGLLPQSGIPASDQGPATVIVQPVQNWLSSSQVRMIIALVMAGFGIYFCFQLMLPFLAPLTWALVLSVTVLPAHRWIEGKLGRRTLAAGISVLAVAVLVVVPMIFMAQRMIIEIANGAVYLEREIRTGDWRQPLSDYPSLTAGVTWAVQQLNLADTAGSIANWMTTFSTAVFRGSLVQLANFVLTFYILFFMLRDRERALSALTQLSALSPTETRDIAMRFADTIHAIVFGTGIIAAVQGTLGGLMFWWLDLPLPLVWGTIMAMLAVVPVLGAFVIWVPASIYLALEGRWVEALILAGWGSLVVSTVDNFLYPVLVGNRLQLHTMVALIASFGGLIVFGASGLILGPAVATVTITLIKILKVRFAMGSS